MCVCVCVLCVCVCVCVCVYVCMHMRYNELHPQFGISIVPIIRSAIGKSRLLGNFVTIGISRFYGYHKIYCMSVIIGIRLKCQLSGI